MYLSQGLPQARDPVVKDVEKLIRPRVCCCAFQQPMPSALAQEFINKHRDLLVCVHPVMVTATEDSEPDIGELARLLAFECLYKATSVVGGLALIGSRKDDHRTVCRDL